MGCDIHGVVEVNGERGWRQVFNLSHLLGRNYYMFGELFGVRGDGKNLFGDRGLPEDADHWTKSRAGFTYDNPQMGPDYHSDSYFLASELSKIKDIEVDPEYDDLFILMKSLGEKYGMNNVRCIVWFDN